MPDWKQLLAPALAELDLPPERETEIIEELSDYLQSRFEEAIFEGQSPEDARKTALEDLPDGSLLESEIARAEQPVISTLREKAPLMAKLTLSRRLSAGIGLDLKSSLRNLKGNPLFLLISVLTLALGIGFTTAIFSVVDGILLKPLPYSKPQQLVRVWGTLEQRQLQTANISEMDFLDFRLGNRTLSEMAVFTWSGNGMTLQTNDRPVRLRASSVSYGFFPVLGVAPYRGRYFHLNEDLPNGPRAVILSHRAWQVHFGSDEEVIGETVTLSGRTYEVAGVMPPTFLHPEPVGDAPDLWLPLQIDPDDNNRGGHYLRLLGRLRPGLSPSDAQRDLEQISGQLAQEYPNSNVGWGVRVEPLHDAIVGNVQSTLSFLLAAVMILLIVACINVAHLFAIESSHRTREFIVKQALGADLFRLFRQLISQALIISLLGTAAGLGVAYLVVELFLSFASGQLPRTESVALDIRVFLFSVGLSGITALFFGAYPFLRYRNPDLASGLKEGGRHSSEGKAKGFARKLLVVGQTALAVLLLVSAGLLAHGYWRLQATPHGVDLERTLMFRTTLPRSDYPTKHQVFHFYKELTERVEALPGVLRASVIDVVPLSSSHSRDGFQRDDLPAPEPGQGASAEFRLVGEGYFETLGINLVRGRLFTPADMEMEAAPVTIIDQQLVDEYYPDKDPLGQSLTTHGKSWRIVGIVENVKHFGPVEKAPPTLYAPYSQQPVGWLSMVLRFTVSPSFLTPLIAREVKRLDPALPVYDVRTLRHLARDLIATPRFHTYLTAIFSLAALLLSIVGIFGVISYSVSLRYREIGIRMAYGARPREIRKMITAQGLKLALLGALLGTLLFLPIGRLLESSLFVVDPFDVRFLFGIPFLFIILAGFASYWPSRRASALDPASVLRQE